MPGCERSSLNSQQRADAELNQENRLQSEAIGELINFAKRNFDWLDKDKNSFLSKDELENPSDKSVETRVLAKYADPVMNLNRDEYSFFENDGITRLDLDKLGAQAIAMPEAMRRARDIRETVGRNFNAIAGISGNQSLILKPELEKAVSSRQYDRCDTVALSAAVEDFVRIGRRPDEDSSRRIKLPHLEAHVVRVASGYNLTIDIGKDLRK